MFIIFFILILTFVSAVGGHARASGRQEDRFGWVRERRGGVLKSVYMEAPSYSSISIDESLDTQRLSSQHCNINWAIRDILFCTF